MRETEAGSHSSSSLLQAMLDGETVRGKVIDGAHAQFGRYVVALTRPGEWRMPNGLETALVLKAGEPIAIGGGRLVAGRTSLMPGPDWNPRPSIRPSHFWPPGPAPVGAELGIGPVWQPAALAGYISGLVILHGQQLRATRLADAAAAGSSPDVATMLRHAALGEVPEPVHSLLSTTDVGALTAFDHGTGASWLRGLVSAGYALDVRVLRAAAGHAR